MIYGRDRLKYRFKNKFCPICGKLMDSYHYRFKEGEKICVEHYIKPKREMGNDKLLSLS